mmetsp:Transcript_48078/g.119037  ORF Transcript_48078/g.119037 Transcript_48078/m.119037 type:complete len:80 (-) Transcript_48078:829-1068(-)
MEASPLHHKLDRALKYHTTGIYTQLRTVSSYIPRQQPEHVSPESCKIQSKVVDTTPMVSRRHVCTASAFVVTLATGKIF